LVPEFNAPQDVLHLSLGQTFVVDAQKVLNLYDFDVSASGKEIKDHRRHINAVVVKKARITSCRR